MGKSYWCNGKGKEEILEIEEEIKNDNQKNIEEEIGDLIFAVINLSRKLKVNPERCSRENK